MHINNLRVFVIFLSALIAFITLSYGFNSANKQGLLMEASKNFEVVGYLSAAMFSIYVLSKKLNLSLVIIGFSIIGLIAVFTNTLSDILISFQIYGAFYLYGKGLTKLIIGRQKLYISPIILILVGLSLVGILVNAMSFVPIGYPGVYLFLVTFPYLLFVGELINGLKKFPKLMSSYSLIDAGLVTMAIYYFMIALMPEIGHDALAMHLFVPGLMKSEYYWSRDVEKYAWAVMPMLGDWIYSLAYVIGGEKTVRLINYSAILLFAWLSGVIASWSSNDKKIEKITALFVLSLPIIFAENSSLFIDSIWSILILGSLLLALQVNQNTYVGNIFLFSVISAGALSTKAISISIILILTVIIFLKIWRFVKIREFKWIFCASLFFIIAGLSPYLISWYLTGNPVFPFFNGVFKSHFYPAINFVPPFQPTFLSPYEIYKMTFSSQEYIEGKFGASGFQFITLLPVAIIAAIINKNNKALSVMILGLLFIAITFLSTGYIRYILPSFGIIIGGIFGALSSKSISENSNLKILFYFLVILTIFLNLIFLKTATNYGDLKLGTIFSKNGRNDYLYHHQPIRLAVEFINSMNFNRASTAFFSSPFAAGLTGNALHPNWYNSSFAKEIADAVSPLKLSEVLLKNRVKYIILDENWGDLNLRKNLYAVSTVVAKFNNVIVMRLRDNYLYQYDVLEGRGNKHGWHGWNNFDSSMFLNDRVNVNQKDTIYMIIKVDANVQYLNRANVSCSVAPTLGRLQINWLDRSKNIIKTDLRMFHCKDVVTTEELAIDSPSNASYAIVFVTGHEQIPVSFYDMQFLGPRLLYDSRN